MSSNCDSVGIPVDHDGHRLEDGVFDSGAPIAVRSDVLREILSGSGKEVETQHVSADLLDDTWVQPSALKGGIPIVNKVSLEDLVEIEDVEEGYDSDEPLSPGTAKMTCANSTISAVLRTTKHERDALYATRKKLNDALAFLRKQGFKEENIFADLSKEGFSPNPPVRDEFGLPQVTESAVKPNPFVDKMKGPVVENPHIVGIEISQKEEQVFDKKPQQPSVEAGNSTKDGAKPKSWTQVLNDSIPKHSPVKLDFFPKAAGASKVSPPIEVLKQGNEKFKNCLVGTFTKGHLSYSKVLTFAQSAWTSKGLLHVAQKDSHTFLFRFKEENDMNSILARGTWFIERRPLIIHNWGVNPCVRTHLPLWVKFEKVPDSYWTREGLSWLASSIGHPLSADNNTSRLEVLPFAKICVDYKIGDPLPTELEVEVLDPSSESLLTEKVLVSYPSKPLICSACGSLGHLVGACPKVTRHWVRKIENSSHSATVDTAVDASSSGSKDAVKADNTPVTTTDPPVSTSNSVPGTTNDGWQEVKRKHSSSPPPVVVPTASTTIEIPQVVKTTAAASLPIYSALTRTLSKNQRKKAKKSGGKSPSSNH